MHTYEWTDEAIKLQLDVTALELFKAQSHAYPVKMQIELQLFIDRRWLTSLKEKKKKNYRAF